LLPRQGKQVRQPLISPRNGITLLLCAAACCFMAQNLFEDEDTFSLLSAAPQSPKLSAGPRAADPIDAPGIDTAGAVAPEDEKSWIRDIPLIGNSIVDSYNAAKMRAPVRDEDRVPADQAPKVKVDVYMEAACPGCQFFTTHVLVPVMEEEGMASITDLNVIAAGNAEVKTDEESNEEVVSCQHGEGECEGNKIISCLAKNHRADPEFVTALGCIEEHSSVASGMFSNLMSNLTVVDMLRTNAGICLTKAKIDIAEVEDCSSSPEGEQMLRSAIKETADLQPAFEYAPWVLVDREPLKDDAYSLKKYICDSYTGPLPPACETYRLYDYFPDKSSVTLSSPAVPASSAAKLSAPGVAGGATRAGLTEGRVHGSNKLFKRLTGETTQEARQDIDGYFTQMGAVYQKMVGSEKRQKAALRANPRAALMQELLAGEMASPRRAFMFCVKDAKTLH